jgi:hypothetical protein
LWKTTTCFLAPTRVARWVCEKITQKVAQPCVSQNQHIISAEEKYIFLNLVLLLFTKKLPRVKNWREFA